MTIVVIDKAPDLKGRQRITWSRMKKETVAAAIQVHGCYCVSDNARLRLMDLTHQYIPLVQTVQAREGDTVIAPFRDDLDNLAVGTVLSGTIRLQ